MRLCAAVMKETRGRGWRGYELHMVRILGVDCLEADVFDVFKHVHIQNSREVLGERISSLHTSAQNVRTRLA